MQPTRTKGEIASVHLRWISKKGPPIKVELLEFIGTSHRQGRYQHGKPKPHYFDGKAWIGEQWKAVELETGKELIVNFPHIIEADITPESSISSRRDISDKIELNLLLDTYEEVKRGMANRTKYPNFLLQNRQRIFNRRLEIMLDMYESNPSLGLFLLIRHKQTPCLRTFNSLKEWREKNKKTYQEIQDYISSVLKEEMEYETVN